MVQSPIEAKSQEIIGLGLEERPPHIFDPIEYLAAQIWLPLVVTINTVSAWVVLVKFRVPGLARRVAF